LSASAVSKVLASNNREHLVDLNRIEDPQFEELYSASTACAARSPRSNGCSPSAGPTIAATDPRVGRAP